LPRSSPIGLAVLGDVVDGKDRHEECYALEWVKEKRHRLAENPAEADDEWHNEKPNLDTAANGDGDAQVEPVFHRYRHGCPMLGRVADDRQEDKPDKLLVEACAGISATIFGAETQGGVPDLVLRPSMDATRNSDVTATRAVTAPRSTTVANELMLGTSPSCAAAIDMMEMGLIGTALTSVYLMSTLLLDAEWSWLYLSEGAIPGLSTSS
jgi:hypothetical protein